MHLRFLSLIFLLFSAQVLADGAVRFADLDDDLNGAESLVRVFNNTSNYFLATYQDPSGDGTSSSAPARVWIPIQNGGGQADYVTASNAASVVPDISGGTGGFRTYLEVTNATGSDRYLYAAVQDPEDIGTYKVTGGTLGSFSSQASAYLYWAPINLSFVCGNIDCSKIEGGANGTNAKLDTLVYFFLSSVSNLGDGFEVSPTDASYSGGSFLRMYLSGRIQQSSIVISEVRRGDGRLRAIFTGNTINDMNRTLAVVNPAGLVAGPIQTALAGGSTLLDLDTTVTSGELNIRPLENNVCYDVVVTFEDKYLIATETSGVQNECPAQIEALLEKQACYILSAGFQEKHFVTEFFRAFRDKFLLHTTFGTGFVDWYYRTAPVYAPYIYSSPTLAFVVRCFAYMLWFLMNLAVIAAPIAIIIVFLNRVAKGRRHGRSQ